MAQPSQSDLDADELNEIYHRAPDSERSHYQEEYQSYESSTSRYKTYEAHQDSMDGSKDFEKDMKKSERRQKP